MDMTRKESKHINQTQENKYPVAKLRRDANAIHHYVKEIRILTPTEYQKLRAAIPKERHRVLLDVLLITGMRYVEVQRLWAHREWYIECENMIHLPDEAQKKVKRRQIERTITPLPSMFNYILKDFFEAQKPPAETNWNKDLRKWAVMAGIHPYGLSAKTTRKTIESWCIKAGMLESTVCLRQGHDSLTSMKHYQGLAFNDNENNDIKKQLTSWGMLR